MFMEDKYTDSYYDSIAKGYEELHGEEQLRKLNVIKNYFSPKEHNKLLDVGCGSGISTRFFSCKRTGIDPSEELIKIAREKDPFGKYFVGFAENLPFKDNFFDYVISLTAIQNFKDITKGLSEIYRVGKKYSVLSFLKKINSQKRNLIEQEIKKLFKITKMVEQEKDIIFICEK